MGLLVFAARETVFPARCVSPTTNPCSAGERKCAKMCDVCNAFSRVSSAIQFWSPLWVYWCLLQGKQCFQRVAFPPLPTHAVLGKGNVPRCVIYVMHFSRVSSAIQFWSPLWVYWCLLQGKQCFRRIAFPPLPTHAVLGKGNVPRCVMYVMHFSRVSSAIQCWSPLWVYWCLLQGKQCFQRVAFPPLPTLAVLGKGNVPRCVTYATYFHGHSLHLNQLEERLVDQVLVRAPYTLPLWGSFAKKKHISITFQLWPLYPLYLTTLLGGPKFFAYCSRCASI